MEQVPLVQLVGLWDQLDDARRGRLITVAETLVADQTSHPPRRLPEPDPHASTTVDPDKVIQRWLIEDDLGDSPHES